MKALMLAGIVTFGLSGAGEAQEADVAAGKAYAEEICAACHAVQAGDLESPLFEAPPFPEVADTPGMTELALSVWLQSSHPTMPNFVLAPDDMRNVVAYIRSLEGEG